MSDKMKTDIELPIFAVIVAVLTLISCYAEWDSVKTKPYYAPSSSYVHYPAPPGTVPVHSQDPQK